MKTSGKPTAAMAKKPAEEVPQPRVGAVTRKQKELNDSLGRTISFVIKGKLTPIKPEDEAENKSENKRQSRSATRREAEQQQAASVENKGMKNKEPAPKSPSRSSKTIKKDENESKSIPPQQIESSKKEESPKKATPRKKSATLRKSPKAETKRQNVKIKTKIRKSNNKPPPSATCISRRRKRESPEALLAEKIKKSAKFKSRLRTPKIKVEQSPNKSIPLIKKEKIENPEADCIKEEKEPPKIKTENRHLSADDISDASDEMTLHALKQQNKELELENADLKEIKKEPEEEVKKPEIVVPKTKPVLVRKKVVSAKEKVKRKSDQRRKMKLFALWNGPKRHRVASLNALAKVHCLYENEGRGSIIDNIQPIKKEVADKKEKEKKEKVKVEKEKIEKEKNPEKVDKIPIPEEENVPARNLRTAPGLRGAGKHWDMHDTTSSSEESSGELPEEESKKQPPVSIKKEEKKVPVKRRKRTEIIMDLKDMVVRKRMASLNASAILAASYSMEKNSSRSPKSSSDSDSDESFSDNSSKKKYEGDTKGEDKLIEVHATPNKKVAVIVNQDTDVTITGVYVNSTTRSTHHEGYCSIAGMQYRISATSHTQTAATAVATETLLQSASSSSQENSNGESTPSKSYTPLDALSNMQPPNGPPPGGQHGVQLPHHHLGPPHISPQLSPLPRRHGCSSAFSAPPGHYPSTHHHPPPPPPPTLHTEQGYLHGYYQPAGPLINVPHGHTQPPPLGKSGPLSETSSVSPPPNQPPQAPSSVGDSSDNDVIITSVTNDAKEASPPQQPYRLSQYPSAAHTAYPYGYPAHYYHTPHHPPPYAHHDLCYSPNAYLHKTYAPYRRYLVAPPPTAQYFQASPQDLYSAAPPAPPPTATQQSQQVVTATSSAAGSASSYQSAPSGPQPPAPTLLESYPPQPPPTLVESYPPPYYAGYGPPPPPPCYSHSPTRSSLPYINAAYQNCPCPLQTCPKNVHTGPLIGNNKRSNINASITKDTILLQPVALALPMEPASATGPPSPARGSAGMPPPPSPAGATYQAPPTPKHEAPEPLDLKSTEKRRKQARVGKSTVRETLHQNTMLLMCQEQEQATSPFLNGVKREVESPKEEQKKDVIREEVVVSKVETTNVEEKKVEKVTITIQEAKTETTVAEPKIEKCEAPSSIAKEILVEPPPTEALEPCLKTVAENVKVKNMKRRPSIINAIVKEEPPPKKIKLEKVGGSYKDLIKKSYTAVQINNGKKKLLSQNIVHNLPKIHLKKGASKRKRIPGKGVVAKKTKLSKPLTNYNAKISLKEKDKTVVETDLENKEPKKGKKTATILSAAGSNTNKSKKSGPAVLDNLIAKNSVDNTIESVISESNGENTRTKNGANGAALRTFTEKCPKAKPPVEAKQQKEITIISNNGKKGSNAKVQFVKAKAGECKKGAAKRKTKSKSADVAVPQAISKIPRRSLPLPKWSNGWEWKGEPFDGKVFLNSDEAIVIRKCYPAMIHVEGDIIEPRDCVLLKAGQRKNDLPFVAKIAALWENPDDGEMMMSLLWYYRPEHTEQGRLPTDQPDEVFASRHKDSNSVACIEDKCYVLTFNEYCRYRKNLRRLEAGVDLIPPCIPSGELYPRFCRQPPTAVATPPEMVFFCRRVYDFRQKRIVKNPS